MKYAVLVKHAFRTISDVRVEIVEVPSDKEDFGPVEAKMLIQEKLLGPFEVIAVTDRISETKIEETKP